MAKLVGHLALLLAALDPTFAGVNPSEKCGCAKPGNSCEHNPSQYSGYASKRYPLPGYTRTGYCTNYIGSDPNGGDTHKVCAKVSKALNDWFTTVHNDLRTVVYPGDGWCLCKHWTRGTLCCNDDATKYLTSSDFDWPASLTKDLEVFQIKEYVAAPSAAGRDALCTTGALSGCTYRRLTEAQRQEAAKVKAAWQAKFDGVPAPAAATTAAGARSNATTAPSAPPIADAADRDAKADAALHCRRASTRWHVPSDVAKCRAAANKTAECDCYPDCKVTLHGLETDYAAKKAACMQELAASPEEADSSTNTGLVIGLAVGAVVLVAIVAVVAVGMTIKRRQGRQEQYEV